MNDEQKKCAREAVEWRKKATDFDERAANATNVESKKDWKRQADECRSDARHCDDLANDRGY